MCAQTFLVITYLSDFTYLALLQLGAMMAMPPYAWAALHGLHAWLGAASVRAPRNDDLQILVKSMHLA
nr:hypothetical protein [uncultured Ottowia sp.]